MSVIGNLIWRGVVSGLAILSACASKPSSKQSAQLLETKLWIAEPSEGYQPRGDSTFDEWREIKNGHASKMLLGVLERNQAKSSVGVPLFNTACRPIGFVIESNGQVIRAGWFNNVVQGRKVVVLKYAQAAGKPGQFRLTPTSRSSDFLWSDLEGCLVNSDEWRKLDLPSDF